MNYPTQQLSNSNNMPLPKPVKYGNCIKLESSVKSDFRADRYDAALMLECKTIDEAKETLSALPFVQNKLITFEIIPLKAYSGFRKIVCVEELKVTVHLDSPKTPPSAGEFF